VKICPLCSTEYRDDVRFCPNDGQTLRSSGPTQDLVGQVLADRYHIMKKLGEGGMGQVYLAQHVKMGRRSAIKVMNPSMANDPEAVARFNREAANASRISDAHVCAIYDFGETPEGLIYMAMEFVEGEPLTELLAREGALPVARAAGICIQVAAALHAAHDLGIVHRDLKPDNIMLTRGRDGADGVKVVDFGIAKIVGGESGQQVTRTGLVVGTPEFMSPEQLAGDKVDGRSDVYSLGLVLFKMLTGALPFPADSVQEAMIKRLTDEPSELIEVRPDLHFPPGLQQVLDTALARRPVDRYQSATKFAHDLAAVLGLSRIADDPSLPETRTDPDDSTELLQPVRTRRRSRAPILVGAVVALGVVGAVVAIGRNVRGTGGVPPADTARYVAVPPPVDTAPRAPVVPPRRDPVPRPRVPPVTRPRIDVTRARDLLDDLLEKLAPRNQGIVRDSARHIFDAPNIAARDKAYAAYVVGLARSQPPENDRAAGCAWIQRAMDLDPSQPRYREVLAQCQR
jgi:eukaryotic-like serine/threonine-protein kinase